MCRRIPAAVVALLSFASTAPCQISSERVGPSFSLPTFGCSAPGDPGRLFVTELGGAIRAFNPVTGVTDPTPFLNLPAIGGTNFVVNAGAEQGLLGMAFDPQYQTNGYVYVHYNYNDGSPFGGRRIERYQASNGVVNPASRRSIMEIQKPDHFHNGGWIGFGPHDGLLYITSGDGGGAFDPNSNAQSKASLLGKMLRVDPSSTQFPGDPTRHYSIPGSNPFANTPGARGEIFAYGLRNPWRASFDRANGDLYLGDVGQAFREEIDFIGHASGGGQNFGWRLREGTIPTGDLPGYPSVGGPRPPDNVDPILDYDRTLGSAVTGGYVYRGLSALIDNGQLLEGTYFFGDFGSSRVFTFRFDGTTVTDFRERTAELRNATNGGTLDLLVSFAEDGFGNLYTIGLDGNIFRIHVTPVPEPGGFALMALAASGWLIRKRHAVQGVISAPPIAVLEFLAASLLRGSQFFPSHGGLALKLWPTNILWAQSSTAADFGLIICKSVLRLQ